ncbi:MAG: hypothetical protein NTX01_05490 [Candidatus Omnitrophica bacterium]|nr:hypothetical protein [Candidatus Omnitrophota bacterium]
MRQQFVKTIESVFEQDSRLVILLGDIGVFGFRHVFEKYPQRSYNIGILEQATLGLAAGLSSEGFIPVVHTIAPFIVERSLEQIKIDFCYQGLGGNFVSVGGSYDYAALGCTHHCPGDIGILKNVPGMQIVVPGHPKEFDRLFLQAYANGRATYFRLSEKGNSSPNSIEFGKALILKKGAKATVIAVGPLLDDVISACVDMDVTILYYTSLEPFDTQALMQNCASSKILLCEPYYSGALDYDVIKSVGLNSVKIEHVGVPHLFLTKYGNAQDHNYNIGLTPKNIRLKLESLINE